MGRKSSGRDRAEGALDKAKGSIKEAAGRLTGDEALKAEGKKDQVKGDVRIRSQAEGSLRVGETPVMVVRLGS